MKKKAYFHLPGLFEFYEFYKVFLPLFYNHREYFYDWCEIGSIYGSYRDCIWSGGRCEESNVHPEDVIKLLKHYSISARLTFSNSLLQEEHLLDKRCNKMCELFEDEKNGIIIYSDILMEYLKKTYPKYHYISSTTKVLTDFELFRNEVNRSNFTYVVPDFRLNKMFDKLKSLTDVQKDKVEFLCNECCYFGCVNRKECYEAVSKQALGLDTNFVCKAPESEYGYRFSAAMENPGFISVSDIQNVYMPMGFTNFKIEGRSLGSALVLEFLLYYMTKPEYHIHVREAIYLDNTLDLF